MTAQPWSPGFSGTSLGLLTARPCCSCTRCPTRAVLAGRGRALASRLPHRGPDARGHGEAARFDPATRGRNRFDDMVADVVFLLERRADEGGAAPILVGHFMGAGVAATVLVRRPDLLGAAVPEVPPWVHWSAK